MINFLVYKTHIKPIKPQKPALIKPIKPAGLGFMIKPGFYANPVDACFKRRKLDYFKIKKNVQIDCKKNLCSLVKRIFFIGCFFRNFWMELRR